jgi:hypothetical protein
MVRDLQGQLTKAGKGICRRVLCGSRRPRAKRDGPLLSAPDLKIGAGKRNRTSDLRVTNALLYQLSYSGKVNARILRA